ncbi:hypothetical protein BDY24DRAFT_412736 [Mrakia frigida]|uniref:uncharacterized protein n=1 Tax=Mrakia frigida TaxID=29902 RepID=UPI003FCBF848
MSLRHISLLFALGPTFFLSAVASQQRKTAASLALSPSPLEPSLAKDAAALQSEQIKAKKRDWKSACLFLLFQLAVFAFFFYGARTFPDAMNYFQLALNTWMVALFSETSLRELLTVAPFTIARNSDGKIVGGFAPAPSSTYLLTFLSFTIFPLALLTQSIPSLLFPLTCLSTLTFTFFFARTIPTSPANTSLRWMFFLCIVAEAFAVLVVTAIALLVQSPLGEGLRDWTTKTQEDKVKGDPWLQDLVLSGVTSLHPLLYFGFVGTLVSALYRLDVTFREGGSGEGEGVEEFGRLPAIEPTTEEKADASEKKKPLVLAGERIVLPRLARSVARHATSCLRDVPVYFLTGVAVVVGLVALVPIVADPFLESPEEAKLDYYVSEVLAALLSPPVLALAISLVSAVRGEASKVWTYRETWIEIKPAPEAVFEGFRDGEEEKIKLEEVEVDGRV